MKWKKEVLVEGENVFGEVVCVVGEIGGKMREKGKGMG